MFKEIFHCCARFFGFLGIVHYCAGLIKLCHPTPVHPVRSPDITVIVTFEPNQVYTPWYYAYSSNLMTTEKMLITKIIWPDICINKTIYHDVNFLLVFNSTGKTKRKIQIIDCKIAERKSLEPG